MVTVLMVWLTVMRFKAVEVRVVKDERENTFNIFEKITFATKFHTVFMITLSVF